MSKLIGTNPNQVPSNADLGTAAYADVKDFLTSRGSEITAIESLLDNYDQRHVFVYDTSKDSDGGAWRHRCQHTSWYNEELNTATRGSRREFPAIAIIVLTNANHTYILDADDPTLPMWMVIERSSGNMFMNTDTNNQGIGASNGVIAQGTTGALWRANLISDKGDFFNNSRQYHYKGDISERNDGLGYTDGDAAQAIINSNINWLHMRTLSDAPIDPVTGIPRPTIAVATNGGVSILKDNDEMVSISFSSGNVCRYIYISSDGRIIFNTDFSAAAGGRYLKIYEIPYKTLTEGPYNYQNNALAHWGVTGQTLIGDKDSTYFHLRNMILDGNDISLIASDGYQDTWRGLTNIYREADVYSTNNLTSYIGHDYNTGWMPQNAILATLADTYTGPIKDRVLNSNTSDWTNIGTHDWTISNAGAVSVSNVAASQVAQVVFGDLQPSRGYTITFTVDSVSDDLRLINQDGNYASDTVITSPGVYTLPFEDCIKVGFVVFQTDSATISSIQIREAVQDRSSFDNHLRVYGNIQRTKVAPGSDLVGYSGFDTTSNYLEIDNFDTISEYPFTISLWFKLRTTATNVEVILSFGDLGPNSGRGFYINSSNINWFKYGSDPLIATGIDDNQWHQVIVTSDNAHTKVYLDGELKLTDLTPLASYAGDRLVIGNRKDISPSYVCPKTSVSLLRVSRAMVSSSQVEKMYEDEKVLFSKNSKATLYGNTTFPTRLAYDEENKHKYVGTTEGMSVFSGLRRIDESNVPVTNALHVVDGLVVRG